MVRSALLFLVTVLVGTAVMVPLLDLVSTAKVIPAPGRPAGAVADADEPAPPAACRIKGDIAISGERVYHLPGGEFYDMTRIDTAEGERWFCTEAAARAAGWRPLAALGTAAAHTRSPRLQLQAAHKVRRFSGVVLPPFA